MKAVICTKCLSRTCAHMVPPPQLSARHADVLRLLARGMSNRQVAEELGLTTGTVKVYSNHLFRRIGVKSRLEAALWARDHAELLTPGDLKAA